MELKIFTCEFVIKSESVGQGLHEVFCLLLYCAGHILIFPLLGAILFNFSVLPESGECIIFGKWYSLLSAFHFDYPPASFLSFPAENIPP